MPSLPFIMLIQAAPLIAGNPIERMQGAARPYLTCVRDNAASWAASTKEPASDVAEAAAGSCARTEQEFKQRFLTMAQADIGLSAADAASAWEDVQLEMRATARRVAMTAIMNARVVK